MVRTGARFERGMGGAYTCDCCGRRTRYTGEQSMGSKTCPECWELAGIENEVSDGYKTVREVAGEVRELMRQCEGKGGKPTFAYALPTA